MRSVRSAGDFAVEPLEQRCVLSGFTVPQGVDGTVKDLVVQGDMLYMVGDFTRAGDVYSPGAAAYNMRTGVFSALGGGLVGDIRAIEVAPDGTLYVGGSFQIRFQNDIADPDLNYDDAAVNHSPSSNPTVLLAILRDNRWTPFGDYDRWYDSSYTGYLSQRWAFARATEIAASGDGTVSVLFQTSDTPGAGAVSTWNGVEWSELSQGWSTYIYGVSARMMDDTLFHFSNGNLGSVDNPGFEAIDGGYWLRGGPSGSWLAGKGSSSVLQYLPFSSGSPTDWQEAAVSRAERVGDNIYMLIALSRWDASTASKQVGVGLWRTNALGNEPTQMSPIVDIPLTVPPAAREYSPAYWRYWSSPSTFAYNTALQFSVSEYGAVATNGDTAITFTRGAPLSSGSTSMLTGSLYMGAQAGWTHGVMGPGGTLYAAQPSRTTTDGATTGMFRRSASGVESLVRALDDNDGIAPTLIEQLPDGRDTYDSIIRFSVPKDADLFGFFVVARTGPTRATAPMDGIWPTSLPGSFGVDRVFFWSQMAAPWSQYHAPGDILEIRRETMPDGTVRHVLGDGKSEVKYSSHTFSATTARTVSFDFYGADAFGHYTLVGSVANYREVQPVVMFVPNFLGSLPRFNLTNPAVAAAQADEFVNTLGFDPVRLYPEQIDKSANKLLEVFDGVPGYRLGENLIFAAYDWRLPVAPMSAADGVIRLNHLNLTDNVYAFAAEYIAYWVERAKDGYRTQYGDLNGFRIHLVTHGTGGLVARAFLQSDLYDTKYLGIVKKVLNIGTPHEGFVDAFFHRDSTVGEMLDGIEPRADADSQKYVQVLREAVARNGMTDTPVPTWVPGISDYMPTFEFIKRGPDGYPPPAGTYDNRFLKDLNEGVESFNWDYFVAKGILNVSSTGVDTPYQVYYSFGTRETRYNALGDGLVLESSALGEEYGSSYVWDPYEWDLPVGFDQRDLINDDRMIAMYREYAALDPVGLVNEQTASLGTHIRRTATGFEFSVVYLHIDDLEIPSFGSNDLAVIGPLGGTLPVSMIKVSDATVFGPIRTVYYAVTLPTGTWRPQDAGLYNIRLRENAVRTYQGVPLDARDLGSIDSREISDTLLGSRAELDPESGMPVVYAKSALNGWRVFHIAGLAVGTERQAAAGTGIQSWQDPKDGLFYVAVSTSDGLYLYQQKSASEWFVRNLTNEIAGSQKITKSLTHFVSRDANRRITIAGLAADGDLVVYQQTGGVTRGDYIYKFHDVADEYLRPIGKQMPLFVGPLISYVTPWNGQNIAGLNASGKIEVIWNTTKTKGYWVHSNLSNITGAPAFNGGLTVYQTSWKGINIVGVNASGNIVTTWWVPRFAGKWATSNLSAIVGGPNLQGVSLVAYQTPSGGLNIAGIRPNGHAALYWWLPNTDNKWKVRQLTKNTSLVAERPAGSLFSQVLGDGSVNLFGRNADKDVVRVYWQPGLLADDWRLENLSDIAV